MGVGITMILGTDSKGKAGNGAKDGARSAQAGGNESDAEEWQSAIAWSYNFDDSVEVYLEAKPTPPPEL
jgi:hypothetical protein